MKKYLFYISLLPVLMGSCKDPVACITASPTTAKLGQPITFTDCSVDAKVSKINYGDGTLETEINGSKAYEYSAGWGEFTVTLNLYNNRDKRKASTSTTINIERPTSAEIFGTWRLYKEEQKVFGFSDFYTHNELWVFYTDGTYTIDGGSPYNWSLANNYLTVDNDSYRITKLYNGDMVLRFDEVPFFPTTYSQYYFVQL
jgi:hypothetical protein